MSLPASSASPPFLVRSGAVPRFLMGAALLLFGTGLSLAAPLFAGRIVVVALAGLLLVAIGYAVIFGTVRCPRCGARWLLQIVRSTPPLTWSSAILRPDCPACGDSR